ncbi:unnamed protein product [Peronospora effusa]|nr:unnamed protein product [Peronospora effusa]
MPPFLVDNKTQTLLFFRLVVTQPGTPYHQEETMGKGSGGGSKGGGSGSKGSSGSGTKGSGGTAPAKASTDNRSNQLNPNNPTYTSSRANG